MLHLDLPPPLSMSFTPPLSMSFKKAIQSPESIGVIDWVRCYEMHIIIFGCLQSG